jgi:hemoglobin
MHTLFDTIDDRSIARLVADFYAAARQDPELGPVFEAALGPEDWPGHMETIGRFWSAVMLGNGRYSGNPVAVHRPLPGLRAELFPRWVALFEATARRLFTPELAEAFAIKARRIADSLQFAVFFRPGAPPQCA